MENNVDQDQQWLLNCLSATLDLNHEVRSFAEASLNQASLQPGFGSALCKVAANKELSFGLRQLAAVLLKQFIKKHWQEGDDAFEQPAVSDDEKAVIRKFLLLSLDDSHRKIRTAVSMAVASIAVYDWPEDWHDLLPYLLNLINSQSNMNGVHGALRCLSLLSGDLDDKMVPKLVSMLFPCLSVIVSSPGVYDNYLRAKALSIVYSCISMLGVMRGVYEGETNELVESMLRPWMDQFCIILSHPVEFEDPHDWGLRIEVLKCLNQYVQNFPNLAQMGVTIIVGPLWQIFVSCSGLYKQSSIESKEDNFEANYDSDGTQKDLDSLVIQLLEFLLTIVGSSKLVKVFLNNLKELVYHTIVFLQITAKQVHTWSGDANQFICDEDNITYSCRVSGVLLLEEVVNSCGIKGINAIMDAAEAWLSESQREKALGSEVWWRMKEAALYALSSLTEYMVDVEASGVIGQSVEKILNEISSDDPGDGVCKYPFLYSRIFTSIAKFSSVLSYPVLEHFLHAAIRAIGMDVPPPVKVGACRTLSQLLPKANKGVIQQQMMNLLSSLTDMLNQASDETLHLVLETLGAAIKAGGELSASVELILSPIILNMWAAHVSDPFISIDVIEVLEAIKSSPGCIHPFASRVLPYIHSILHEPRQQPDGMVSGSLDLLTMLLKNAPNDVVKAAYDACFDAVISIILQSDDHNELQNATESLAAFVAGGKLELLTWSNDSGFTMKKLFDSASRLLYPNLESSGSLFVGSYLLQLILYLASQMVPHIPNLVAAMVRRMQSVQIAGLRSSLLLIFARLIHMSAPNIGQFIDLLISIPAEGHNNSFVYLMSEWTKLQDAVKFVLERKEVVSLGEIQGAYQIKVTTSALALVLSTQHAELPKINVQGYLVKSSAGITTRSKAKSTPDQWTVVPLPVKILGLLADALGEIQEQVLVDDEEDSDWEDAQTDNVEINEHLLHLVDSTSTSRPTLEHLQAMANVSQENQEDDYEDDLLSVSDPLNQINLAKYLEDFLINFSKSNQPFFDHLFQSLAPAQKTAIQMVLSQ